MIFLFGFVKTVFRDTQNQSLAAENLDGIPIPEHSLSMSTNYLPYSRRTRTYCCGLLFLLFFFFTLPSVWSFFYFSFSHCQVYDAVIIFLFTLPSVWSCYYFSFSHCQVYKAVIIFLFHTAKCMKRFLWIMRSCFCQKIYWGESSLLLSSSYGEWNGLVINSEVLF